MKVGPRNAMVIAVVSLAMCVDEERNEIRVSFGSAGPEARGATIASQQTRRNTAMGSSVWTRIDTLATHDALYHVALDIQGRRLI